MSFRAKELPTITHDVVINNNIYVVAKKLHLINEEHEFVFDKTWHIKTDANNFVDLGMGACPNFTLQERIEHEKFDDFFEEQNENN